MYISRGRMPATRARESSCHRRAAAANRELAPSAFAPSTRRWGGEVRFKHGPGSEAGNAPGKSNLCGSCDP